MIDQGWLCPLVGQNGIKQKRSITNNQGPLNSAAAAVSPIQGKEMNGLTLDIFTDDIRVRVIIKSNLHYC